MSQHRNCRWSYWLTKTNSAWRWPVEDRRSPYLNLQSGSKMDGDPFTILFHRREDDGSWAKGDISWMAQFQFTEYSCKQRTSLIYFLNELSLLYQKQAENDITATIYSKYCPPVPLPKIIELAQVKGKNLRAPRKRLTSSKSSVCLGRSGILKAQSPNSLGLLAPWDLRSVISQL